MSGVFKSLRRMVSWTREKGEAVAQSSESKDASSMPAPPAPKSVKRKFDDEDDGRADSLSKRAKPDVETKPAATSEDGAKVEGVAPVAEKSITDNESASKPDNSAPLVAAEAEAQSVELVNGDSAPAVATTPSADEAEPEDEPKPAPDSPEPQAEDTTVFPALDESGVNVFLSWADGLIYLLEDVDADPPVFWLKSKMIEHYSSYVEDNSSPDELDYSIGYWGIDIDSEEKETALAKAFISAWTKTRAKARETDGDDWWWEVTLVRAEPEDDTPRIKAQLTSSTHNEDHEVAGGRDLGEWWITGIQVASPEAANIMTMHRALY